MPHGGAQGKQVLLIMSISNYNQAMSSSLLRAYRSQSSPPVEAPVTSHSHLPITASVVKDIESPSHLASLVTWPRPMF